MMNINSKINQSGTNYCFKYVFLYFPTISCFTGFGNFCVFLSSQNHQFPDFQSTNPNYHVSTNWLAVSDNILFMADSYCCHVTVHKLWEGFPFLPSLARAVSCFSSSSLGSEETSAHPANLSGVPDLYGPVTRASECAKSLRDLMRSQSNSSLRWQIRHFMWSFLGQFFKNSLTWMSRGSKSKAYIILFLWMPMKSFEPHRKFSPRKCCACAIHEILHICAVSKT